MGNILHSTAKIYKDCDVRNCILGEETTVGDFSRLANCILAEHVIIQRNNMIYDAKLGRYSYTGKNATIWHSEIGAFCSLSWNVSIGGANHDYERVTTHSFLYAKDFGLLPDGECGYDRFDNHCIIGNDVWIAANACICRGVKVGDGAVIAAGAVVTKDVEPYTIVAGVPAKAIKKRFDDETIKRLLKIQWWKLPSDIIKNNYNLFNCYPSENVLNALEKICGSVE